MKFTFEEEEDGRRSHKRRRQLKACSSSNSDSGSGSEKVCFVLQFHSSDGYYVFVSDVSLSNNTRNIEDLVPLVHLEFLDSYTVSMCGLDSTLYMALEEPLDRRTNTGVQPVYALDLEHYIDLEQLHEEHTITTKYLKKRHLRMLPRMSCPKVSAAIQPVPNSKNVVVFSTLIGLCSPALAFPCDDNVLATCDDDPSMLEKEKEKEKDRADFEMYDAHTKSWVTLPRFYIRPASKLASTPIFQLYDTLTHSWNKIDIDYSLLPDRYERYSLRIIRFSFINDHALVVRIYTGFSLTLDLSSLARGWKVLHKELELPLRLPLPLPTSVDEKEKEKKNEVFIDNDC